MKKILFFVLLLAIIYGGYYLFKIDRNRLKQIPAGAINLEFPLENGSYKIIQSGPNGTIHNLSVEKYALDIVRQEKINDFFKFHKANLESNSTFNTPVYSPCAGKVVIAVDGFNDMPIGIRGQANEANHVTINCGRFNVALVHFKKDSILIKVNDPILAGQQIGLVGNSGSSDGPHLHIMAYQGDINSSVKTPLPITFDGRYLSRGDIYP